MTDNNNPRGGSKTKPPSSLKRLLAASVPYYYYFCSATIASCGVQGFVLPQRGNIHDVARGTNKRFFRSRWMPTAATATTTAAVSRRAGTGLFSTDERTKDKDDATGDQSTEDEYDDNSNFATTYHAPVMVNECLDALLDCERGRIRNPKQPKQNKKKKKKRNKKNYNNNNAQTQTQTDDADEQRDRAFDPGGSSSVPAPPLVFVDGTLGGGGHSNALLQRLRPGDILFGCDVDPNALETASERLSEYTNHPGTERPLFVPVSSNFGDLAETLPTVVHPFTGEPILDPTGDGGDRLGGVDGILLDLGVSSHQIDEPARGFSFMRDGPLDMRMGSANGVDGTSGNNSLLLSRGLTAADICNEFDAQELQRIFSVYGDEPRAKTVAGAIVDHRPLFTTGELTEAIASVTPQFARNKRHGRTATCARVFQSLRIVVNNEDGVLGKVLSEACPSLLRSGGRLVVMSYHSMEDRATKRIMRDGTLERTRRAARDEEKDLYGNYIGPPKPFRPVQKRTKATPEETERNPRARSAILRVAEREDN